MTKRLMILRTVPRAIALVVGCSAVVGVVSPSTHARGVPSPAASAPSATRLHRAPRIRGRNGTSTNWSGYAVTGSDFRYVHGTWTVPNVADNPAGLTHTYSSVWVGIDGDNSNTVEQCGTEQDGIYGQPPSYSAWYEMYPKWPVTLPNTVSAGDLMDAVVQSGNGGSFTLTLSDKTQGWKFTTTQKLNQARRSCAEWVAEAPWSGGVLPLANFTSVLLQQCVFASGFVPSAPSQATGLYSYSVQHPSNTDQINMVSSSDSTKLKALTNQVASDNTFSVDWKGYQ